MSSSLKTPPEILQVSTLFETQRIALETVALRFSNQEERLFERVRSKTRCSVLVIPLIDKEHILLIQEYSVGVERYTLSFPKGAVEGAESVLVTAQRELQEEIGYGAHSLQVGLTLSVSPGYFSAPCQVILAQDLYPASSEGDEPEPLIVEKWSLDAVDQLLSHPDFIEARSVAALLWLERAWRLGKGPFAKG